MEKIKKFFRTRGIGFYLVSAASIISIINAFVYLDSFGSSQYKTWWAYTMPLVAVALFVALSLYKPTTQIAPAAFTLATFIALLMFFRFGYMYIADISFNQEFSLALIGIMDPGYVFCVIAMIIDMGLGIAGIFVRQVKVEKNIQNIESSKGLKA